MPDDEIKKLYHSIGEVGALVDLEPHVLRYWESEFADLSPRKNRAGRRVYTESDIATLRRIQHLLKEEKYTLDGARQALARERSGTAGTDREVLLKLRVFLADLLEKL